MPPKPVKKTTKSASKTQKASGTPRRGTPKPSAAGVSGPRKRAKVASAAPAPKKRTRIPYDELRARKQLVERALDDIRNLMSDADPIGAPTDFAEREQKAIKLFDEIHSLLPSQEPLAPEERERLERELADKPDDETLRKILLEMERFLDDPAFPEEYRDQVDRSQIRDALAALDEVALLTPIARATAALADELRTPRVHDPKAAAVRREAEKLAAKRRS
jgi:hypothetical protein